MLEARFLRETHLMFGSNVKLRARPGAKEARVVTSWPIDWNDVFGGCFVCRIKALSLQGGHYM